MAWGHSRASPPPLARVRRGVDTSSEITTKDLKEKGAVEEAENRRDAPANGNTSEENGAQEADSVADEEEGGGGR